MNVPVFAVLSVLRFFWSKITFSRIFRNFEKIFNFSFLIWKGNKIVSSLQKKSFESNKRFGSYRTLKLKNQKNFATFVKKIFNFTVKIKKLTLD